MFETLGPVVAVVVIVLSILLALLTILMPYFVWQLHENVGKIREAVERKDDGELSALPELIEALSRARDSQGEILSSLAQQQRLVGALAEQQRTINSLRARLDRMERIGGSTSQVSDQNEDLVPDIPIEEVFDDLDEDEEPRTESHE
jgi:predicted PurR-regulated permease PerM